MRKIFRQIYIVQFSAYEYFYYLKMLYTLLFVGGAVLEVMGMIPQEIKSSGITIEGMLSKYFGDEVRLVK